MSKLDRSKPFAEVFGVGDVAHRYEQDGKKFDHSGHEIVSGRSPAQQKPAAPPVIPAVPRAPSGGRGTGGGSDPLDSDDFDEFSAAFDKRMASRKRRS